jgi:hypothetical protein
MIKIKIKTRMNLTLLAKAYWDNILPRGKAGEVYYDKDAENEVRSLYFKNETYYKELMDSIKANQHSFYNSNNGTDWKNLFDALAEYEKVEKVDYGILDHYSLTNENFGVREIDESIIESSNPKEESFLVNMKRLYRGYNVEYWGSSDFVIIHLPLHSEVQFNFDLKPIISLLSRYNKTLDRFNIYRDPSRGLSIVRIGIK